MPSLVSTAETLAQLPHMRWSLKRYHAAIEAGLFTDEDRVELLFGKIVRMSPVGIADSKVVSNLMYLFSGRFSKEEYFVGSQAGITLVDDSEPEPDLFVAKGAMREYTRNPFPNDLLLVVEVADSTLIRDRTVKVLTYAVAGIEEYWIVNVYERQVEQYLNPLPTEGRYETQQIHKAGDTFTSLHLGDFAVDNLLV